MVTLAANLSLMFTERPFLERFAAAADAGFTNVEFMFPYAWSPDEVADAARGLEVVLFNMPAGDWDGGERGIACHPDRIDETRAGIDRAREYARALGCPRLHLMAGKRPAGDPAEARRTLIDNVRHAADAVGDDGIDVLLEPINTRVDMPGYFYDTSAAAVEILRATDRANVKLQYDIYHMQIMEGDLARTIERLLPDIGHMQLADNPGRHEPGTGEIAFDWLFRHIDGLGYTGAIGCEYHPAGETRAGLAWARPYLNPSRGGVA